MQKFLNGMKPKQLSKNNITGFTLIEMLVVTAIMVILTSIVLVNYGKGNRYKSVTLGADIVASSVRSAQNYSLNPQLLTNADCSPDNVPTEFHVKFNTVTPTTYTLFAYAKCDATPTPILIQKFDLPKNVRMKQENGLVLCFPICAGTGAGGGTLEIKYIPPFAKVTASLNGGPYQAFNTATIILETTDGIVTKNININGISGRVDPQ
jgi:prepilin-type N-terminal cleavage/methylation domain-containing protein